MGLSEGAAAILRRSEEFDRDLRERPRDDVLAEFAQVLGVNQGSAMSSEQDAFLAAIRQKPHDDAPRLVYADWLDERDIDPAQAELIRLQCSPMPESRHREDFIPECACARCAAYRRAGEIIRVNATRWVPPPDAGRVDVSGPLWKSCGVRYEWGHAGQNRFRKWWIGWERGLLVKAWLPLADWLSHGPWLYSLGAIDTVVARDLRPAVWVATHADRPFMSAGFPPGSRVFCWYRDSPSEIPDAVFRHLTGRVIGHEGAYYRKSGDAVNDLSAACLAYAALEHQKAELPPVAR